MRVTSLAREQVGLLKVVGFTYVPAGPIGLPSQTLMDGMMIWGKFPLV